MFLVLDTDHFTALVAGGAPAARISREAEEREADLFSTIITAQEVIQGWFAAINREGAGVDQLVAYSRFQAALRDLQKLTLLSFDVDAAATFHDLHARRLRTGTMDLKIASICIAHDATLLTRNIRDFEAIPSLRIENWLD